MPEKSGRRLEVELEAAEALAALAHHIISPEKDDDDSQRFIKQFKKTNDSSTTPQERAEVMQRNTNTMSSSVMHSQRAENRMRCRAYASGSCMKPRNYLTEAEREERRIRRVLANRESARQTIQRRQAMREQLSKNAAVLATENENLKTKKEQALTKYCSLKRKNECLKDLLHKASKAEATRIQCGEISPVPALLCSRPSVVPFFWPTSFNPPDACQPQCTCQKCISIASPAIVPLASHANSDQGMHQSNGVGAPVYVMPLPWFFPLQMQCILQSSQPSMQYLPHDVQNEGCMNVLFGAGSFPQAGGQQMSSNATNINFEIPHLTMSACQDYAFGVAPDETCKQRVETMAFKATSYCGGASVTPQASQTTEEDDSKAACFASPSPSPSRWGLATKSEKPIKRSSKKSSSAAAAAEARMRRKELTKLKTFYNRNHCMR